MKLFSKKIYITINGKIVTSESHIKEWDGKLAEFVYNTKEKEYQLNRRDLLEAIANEDDIPDINKNTDNYIFSYRARALAQLITKKDPMDVLYPTQSELEKGEIEANEYEKKPEKPNKYFIPAPPEEEYMFFDIDGIFSNIPIEAEAKGKKNVRPAD